MERHLLSCHFSFLWQVVDPLSCLPSCLGLDDFQSGGTVAKLVLFCRSQCWDHTSRAEEERRTAFVVQGFLAPQIKGWIGRIVFKASLWEDAIPDEVLWSKASEATRISYLCLIHSLATSLWLISLVSLSRPAAPETRRLLGKNKPNPWTPHPPGLLDYINIFQIN